jgi:hypothetical protein
MSSFCVGARSEVVLTRRWLISPVALVAVVLNSLAASRDRAGVRMRKLG